MKDTYGRSLPLPSMRFDLESSSWRTCEATSLWDLEMSSPSFPEWGTTQGGELFELPTPERPTVGQGSSSLPTPTARDYKDTSIAAAGHRPSDEDTLSRALHHLLPTPVADNSLGLEQPGTDFSSLPNVAINLLSTPRARLEGNDEIKDRGHNFLEEQIAALLPTPTVIYSKGPIAMQKNQMDKLRDITWLLPTPLTSDANTPITHTQPDWERVQLRDIGALLPTPLTRPSKNGQIWVRPDDEFQNLENAIAHMPSVNALLPTPVVNDMGSDKTLEWWEAWTKKIGGHGDSLSIEMRKLTGESTTEPLQDGSEYLEDQRPIQLSLE